MEFVIPSLTQKHSATFELADGQLTIEGVLNTTYEMQYDPTAGMHLPVPTEHSFSDVEIWHWSDDGDIIVWANEDTEAYLDEHSTRLAADVEQMLLEMNHP